MPHYLLALDQGTTSCRSILFRSDGSIVSSTQRPFRQYYPQPGWVEHDPNEILSVQVSTLQETVAKANISVQDIVGLGITNQRETIVVWDRQTGQPVYPAIVWQCRRTADLCQTLKDEGLESFVRERTGLPIDAYFSATKLTWLFRQMPELRRRAERGELLAGTIDSWLIWHLTGRQNHITDVTNASRTLLMNIDRGEWDESLLKIFGIPRQILPDIVPSSHRIGLVDPAILPGQIPICGVAGDQQASLFGQACVKPGMTKNTYGTGCFILMYTGQKKVVSHNGLLTTVAWDLGYGLTYALEGSVFNAGSAIQWLKEEVGLIDTYAACDQLASSVPDSSGVQFVPAFTGLGAPYWNMNARGMMLGLTRGSGRAQIARAVLESIAHQSSDILDCMKQDAFSQIPVLRVDGGASVSDWTMQFQSDISGLYVDRATLTETTAWGAASLAGLACGLWPDTEKMNDGRQSGRLFQPRMPQPEREASRAAWKKAVQTACFYAQTES